MFHADFKALILWYDEFNNKYKKNCMKPHMTITEETKPKENMSVLPVSRGTGTKEQNACL